MNKMKKQFVTYPIALALKELGFDERCLGHFDIQSKVLYVGDTEMNVSVLSEILLPAPLWQQVIDLLREEYHIIIVITPYRDLDGAGRLVRLLWDYTVYKSDFDDITNSEYYQTPEEAREAAILQAIEIIKNK